MRVSAISSVIFPYTTLFRSQADVRHRAALPVAHRDAQRRQVVRREVQAVPEPGVAAGRDRRYGQRRGRWRCLSTRSEEHTSELQSQSNLVCRLLLEKKKKK